MQYALQIQSEISEKCVQTSPGHVCECECVSLLCNLMFYSANKSREALWESFLVRNKEAGSRKL